MELCTDHFEKLEARIARVGLKTLVHVGEDASNRFLEFMEGGGEWTVDTFDPMIDAQLAIACQTTRLLGGSFMEFVIEHESEDHIVCPLCLLNGFHEQLWTPECGEEKAGFFDAWLEYAADEALERWEALRT